MNNGGDAVIPVEFTGDGHTSVLPATLEEYARHRLHFALRRFRDHVRKVSVRLIDENGPRRGVDSRCVVAAELEHGAPILVEATTAWPMASITAAARRLNEVLRRRVDREHGRRRRTWTAGGPDLGSTA
jgi:ribosome-associated translation inhibitor RaiA